MAQKRMSEATKKRLRAGRMLQAGKECAQVALAVGVARQTVYTWKRLFDEGGIDALRAVPERGRPAQLDEQQLAAVRAAILRSPTEYGLALSFGHSSAWAQSSNACMVCASGRHRFGESWAVWVSAPRSQTNALSNGMKMPCVPESGAPGLRLKKSPARRAPDRLHRRVGYQRASHASTHLGPQRADPNHPVSFQLESCLGYCGADTHQLYVPAARRQHQEGRDRRIPQGAQRSLETTAAYYLGWIEGASQSPSARVSGRPGWAYPNRIPATVRTRPQSGGIFVGLAQASCAGQLLSCRSFRVAHHRSQQA